MIIIAGSLPRATLGSAQKHSYYLHKNTVIISAEQNILPFAKFIREEMSVDWSKEPARK